MEMLSQLWEWLLQFFNILVHLDVHLAEWIRTMGPWLYVVVFLVVFCETGLVVTPFLPGDSLLFALGAFTVPGSDGGDAPLNVWFLFVLLSVAGILGDASNYLIGKKVGPKIFYSETSKLLNKEHLLKTQAFYEKYGGKTIIIARFIPIIRTFAPFVAGIGKMNYSRFAMFNVVGGIVWVALFLFAGHFFGNLPAVKSNFHLVIVAIILISVMPPVIEWVRARRAASQH